MRDEGTSVATGQSGTGALDDHLRDAKEFVQRLGGRIDSGPEPVEIAGLPAYEVSVGNIEFNDGTIVGAQMLLIFRRDAMYLLVCQYEASAEPDVLAAWTLATETFHV